jgi:hypothetical protein
MEGFSDFEISFELRELGVVVFLSGNLDRVRDGEIKGV